MSSKTTTEWTCDRCGVVQSGALTTPLGWKRVQVISPLPSQVADRHLVDYRDRAFAVRSVTIGDLCGPCSEMLVLFANAADETRAGEVTEFFDRMPAASIARRRDEVATLARDVMTDAVPPAAERMSDVPG